VWKKIYPYIIGFAVGCITLWAISSGISNSKIDKLSNTINESKIIANGIEQNNFRLIESNTRLSESNRQLQTGIDRLTKQINDRDTEYQRQLEEIRNRFGNISITLGKVAEGLADSTGSIQSIIDGLEQIKNLISTLKFN
jgi:uncharacterized protein YlxW (UPF0749 family)